MEPKYIYLKLQQVDLWSDNQDEISCRISVEGQIGVLSFDSSLKIPLSHLSPDIQIHLLIQTGNIALGSVTLSLEQVFGADLSLQMDEWFEFEVPGEVVALVESTEAQAKLLKVRIVGAITGNQDFEFSEPELKEEEEHVEAIRDQEPDAIEESKVHNFIEYVEANEVIQEYSVEEVVTYAHVRTQNQETVDEVSEVSITGNATVEPQTEVIEEIVNQQEDSQTPESEIELQKEETVINEAEKEQFIEYSADKEIVEEEKHESVEVELSQNAEQSQSLEHSIDDGQNQILDLPSEVNTEQIIEHQNEEQSIEVNSEIQIEPLVENKPESQNKQEEEPVEIKPKEDEFEPDDAKIEEVLSQKIEEVQKIQPEEAKEKPDRARPHPLPIFGPIRSGKCSYIDNVKGTEHHQKYIQGILDKLKDEMGPSFLKLVEDATRSRSRSPTRSPTKKLTGRSPTRSPSKTPGVGTSFSSVSKEEEEFIEIAGNCDVYLEKLSIKTKSAFIACVVALLAKQSLYEVQSKECEPIREVIEVHEKAVEVLESSASETKDEMQKEFLDCEDSCTELTDEIKRYEDSWQGLKKKNELLEHEKESVAQQLSKFKSQVSEHGSESEISQLIEDIQDIRKAFENSQSKRNRMKHDFEEFSRDRSKYLDQVLIENLRLTESKSSLLDDFKSKSHQFELVSQENDALRKEIQMLEGQLSVQEAQKEMLSAYQATSKSHDASLEQIKRQVVAIRSAKENYASEAFTLHQNLESEIKKFKNMNVVSASELEQKSSLISELKSKLKNLKDYIKQLEEIFAKKQNIDSVFEVIQAKGQHDFESKDMLVSELSYFSDFVFSLTQSYLKEHRIFKRLKTVYEEKEYELNAMRHVVAEVKMQNPVYFPVKDDNIDQALAAYLNSRDEVVPVPFIREANGVYLFGSRRVLVSFERGKLTVKVGGGFLPVDDFVESYCDVEFEKFGNKNEERSPRMKKLMAKWVGGLVNHKENFAEDMKEDLIKAVGKHRYSTAYGVRTRAKSRSRSQSPGKLISDELIAQSIDGEIIATPIEEEY